MFFTLIDGHARTRPGICLSSLAKMYLTLKDLCLEEMLSCILFTCMLCLNLVVLNFPTESN